MCEPQLAARSRARLQARDVTLAPRCRRDVTDGGLGSRAEAQGARATSSGGYFGVVIHRTGPYPAYGDPEPVSGAPRGRRDGFGNPGPMAWVIQLYIWPEPRRARARDAGGVAFYALLHYGLKLLVCPLSIVV